MKSLECADLRCGRRFVEKSGALVPSRTQWWGRKSCARKQHRTADEPWRRPTSLSLSLSRQASVFLLHFHFIFPKPTFQMCPRLAFLRLKFSPRWEKRRNSEERLLSWLPKGVLFLFFMDGWDLDVTTWSCGSMRRLRETVTSRGEGVVENRSI